MNVKLCVFSDDIARRNRREPGNKEGRMSKQKIRRFSKQKYKYLKTIINKVGNIEDELNNKKVTKKTKLIVCNTIYITRLRKLKRRLQQR